MANECQIRPKKILGLAPLQFSHLSYDLVMYRVRPRHYVATDGRERGKCRKIWKSRNIQKCKKWDFRSVILKNLGLLPSLILYILYNWTGSTKGHLRLGHPGDPEKSLTSTIADFVSIVPPWRGPPKAKNIKSSLKKKIRNCVILDCLYIATFDGVYQKATFAWLTQTVGRPVEASLFI